MARPIPATPTLYGKDAEAVLHEMYHGTPNTPQRYEMFRRIYEMRKLHIQMRNERVSRGTDHTRCPRCHSLYDHRNNGICEDCPVANDAHDYSHYNDNRNW